MFIYFFQESIPCAPMWAILGPSRSHVAPFLLRSSLGLLPFGSPERPPNDRKLLKSSVWGSLARDPQMELFFLKSSVWGSPGEDPQWNFFFGEVPFGGPLRRTPLKFSWKNQYIFLPLPLEGPPNWISFFWKVPFGGPLGRTPKWNFCFWKVPFGRPLGRTPQTNSWFFPHIFLPLILPL